MNTKLALSARPKQLFAVTRVCANSISDTMLRLNIRSFLSFVSKTSVGSYQRKVHNSSMDLESVVCALKDMYPLDLASSWDNVGLLLEPSEKLTVKNILLTNDLTERVMDEAIEKKIDLIFSYHPPLFRSFKQVSRKNWKERNLIRCLENRIAVYSPHTAVDAVRGGINDWLLSIFQCDTIEPIESIKACFNYGISFVADNVDFVNEFAKENNVLLVNVKDSMFKIYFKTADLALVLASLNKNNVDYNSIDKVSKVEQFQGMGRVAKLSSPLSINEAINKVKKLLHLNHLRLALSPSHTHETLINSIAVCPGSGASLFVDVKADLFITGEMSHHEVLDLVHKNSTVILCEHSNTERGFLPNVQQDLKSRLNSSVQISIAENDHDPLVVI